MGSRGLSLGIVLWLLGGRFSGQGLASGDSNFRFAPDDPGLVHGLACCTCVVLMPCGTVLVRSWWTGTLPATYGHVAHHAMCTAHRTRHTVQSGGSAQHKHSCLGQKPELLWQGTRHGHRAPGAGMGAGPGTRTEAATPAVASWTSKMTVRSGRMCWDSAACRATAVDCCCCCCCRCGHVGGESGTCCSSCGGAAGSAAGPLPAPNCRSSDLRCCSHWASAICVASGVRAVRAAQEHTASTSHVEMRSSRGTSTYPRQPALAVPPCRGGCCAAIKRGGLEGVAGVAGSRGAGKTGRVGVEGACGASAAAAW